MTVTFCGHRDVAQYDDVRKWLFACIEQLILGGARDFYLGGYGCFDALAASVLQKLKEQYPATRSILVLPYLDRKVYAAGYDSTVYPPLENVPKRYAIVRRNEWMVEQADVIVAYVCHGWGGAATTLAYAQRKKKHIILYRKTI